jgi:hypothetical protein
VISLRDALAGDGRRVVVPSRDWLVHPPRMRTAPCLVVLALALGCGGATPSVATRTPPPIDARPSDQGALARLSARWPDGSSRTCAIVWTSPGTAWRYDGTMTMTRTGAYVRGEIVWRLLAADPSFPELASRIGDTAGERIEGALDATTGSFVLRTVWLGDPTLNGPAMYRLELTSDGFEGATAGEGDGIWDGVVECGAPAVP